MFPLVRSFLREDHPYLLSVILVQLGVAAAPPPQAENLVLRAVGHVDHALVPPALDYHAVHRSQHEAVVADLEEPQITLGVDPRVHGERLPVHLPGRQGLQIDVVSVLRGRRRTAFLARRDC